MTVDRSHTHLWPGVPLALTSAVLFGAAPPLAKLLTGAIGSLMLAGLLYLGAGIGLAVWLVVRGRTTAERGEAALGWADLPWLAGAVAMGGMVAPVLLMAGLARTSASSSALLLNLEGLATMAIAWVVVGEAVDRRLLAGAAAILGGALLLAWDGSGPTVDVGALLVVGACIAWGIDNNLTRKVSAADPVVITLIKGCVAGSVNVGLALAMGAPVPPPAWVAGAAIVGFFGVGVSLVLFIRALRHLGTARTGAYFSLAPFIGAILAIALLDEPITLRLLLSGLLMGFGLWLHLAERHEHDHRHEDLAHDHAHVHDDHHRHDHEPADAATGEPHAHRHRHLPLDHSHPHYPDLHHRHDHRRAEDEPPRAEDR
ncbi:DMT family transporter [Siculibacillus lacustris]|uniref:DMT family transporter n=1 Tax=Siculibacillus lacustris TaxID=1549641 RepID=A0A4Q9VI44_9HYPH|nr:DMT family transporter [Siculibacillus lacustris]TBW34870.1 DMT family transporter [Siculibacillus lacustris]